MMHNINFKRCSIFVVLISVLASCEKTNITFGTSSTETDPNITFFDNYETTIATYKIDSFLTSDHSLITLGYHNDPVFGVIKASSFAELTLPGSNPIAGATSPVVYDSLELIFKRTGEFYGDSNRAIKINVYRLNKNIKNSDNSDSYYNTSDFGFTPGTIGERITSLSIKADSNLHIKLSDAIGQDLFNKFKSKDDVVSSKEKFIEYFKGIYINTDSVITNSIGYFNIAKDSPLVRLTYHESGLFPEKKHLDFNCTSSKQFSNISFRFTNPIFSSFINKKLQIIPSAASSNQSFLNSNLGASIKISFPTLLNLKELHPYIKVVKAILVIRPDLKSYTSPYQLPGSLTLYSVDKNNTVNGTVTTNGSAQTGNLNIDYLYDKDTYYSYDVTDFINTKINEGQFSNTSLLLSPSQSNSESTIQRLIVNSQSSQVRPIELKLYVLGL